MPLIGMKYHLTALRELMNKGLWPEPVEEYLKLLVEQRDNPYFDMSHLSDEDARLRQFLIEVFAEVRLAIHQITGISKASIGMDPSYFAEDPLLPFINRFPLEIEIRGKMDDKWKDRELTAGNTANMALQKVLVRYGLWSEGMETDVAIRLMHGYYGATRDVIAELENALK